MTRHERRSRPDRPRLERSLDVLLEGSWRGDDGPGRGGPDEDPARWQPVAQVLAALTSAPESSELTGEARALAEFRARPGAGSRTRGAQLPPRAPHRDPGGMPWLRLGRPAATAAAAAVLVGGLLVVAYAGDLPAPAQRLAHDTIGAPAAGRTNAPVPDGSSPAASPLPTGTGQASQRADHAPARTHHRESHGSASGSPYHHRPSGSPPGTPGHGTAGNPGRTGPSGSPGGFPAPQPSQPSSPSASTSPPGSATPSPAQSPSP